MRLRVGGGVVWFGRKGVASRKECVALIVVLYCTRNAHSRSRHFVLRSNEDRLSGLGFIFGVLIDRYGAKGSSQSVGTWMSARWALVRVRGASASHGSRF